MADQSFSGMESCGLILGQVTEAPLDIPTLDTTYLIRIASTKAL